MINAQLWLATVLNRGPQEHSSVFEMLVDFKIMEDDKYIRAYFWHTISKQSWLLDKWGIFFIQINKSSHANFLNKYGIVADPFGGLW